jgi:hypothetical protein
MLKSLWRPMNHDLSCFVPISFVSLDLEILSISRNAPIPDSRGTALAFVDSCSTGL